MLVDLSFADKMMFRSWNHSKTNSPWVLDTQAFPQIAWPPFMRCGRSTVCISFRCHKGKDRSVRYFGIYPQVCLIFAG